MRSMVIRHLANTNSTNVGNGALTFGAERLLGEDLGPGVRFERDPWDDYTFGLKQFDEGFVDMVNGADAWLIGGAVTINGRPYLKNTGMRVDLPLPLWKKIRRPIVFYGISYRVWPFQTFYNVERFKETLDYILDQPNILFGVRNDGTKPWIERLIGRSSERILTVPDPGVFAVAEERNHPELRAGKRHVIVALNNEDQIYRWGGEQRELAWQMTPGLEEAARLKIWESMPGWRETKQRFLEQLAKVLVTLVDERDVYLVLTPHYLDDLGILAELLDLLPPRIAHQRSVTSGLAWLDGAPAFYGRYQKADLALSMRVHSMSPAIGLGTPVVPLVSQDRMRNFLSGIGLGHLSVEVTDPDLTGQVLTRAFRGLDSAAGVRAEMATAVAAMREQARVFNRRVAALLSK